jgi:hypothetical protein
LLTDADFTQVSEHLIIICSSSTLAGCVEQRCITGLGEYQNGWGRSSRVDEKGDRTASKARCK